MSEERDNKYTVTDMFSLAVSKKPVEFSDAFLDVVHDKLSAAVELKKQELARSFFSRDREEDQDGQAT